MSLTFEKFEARDIKRVYRSICRLDEESWSKWNISPNMRVILSLSRKLREGRHSWKSEAHRKRNRNRSPEGHPRSPQCQACKLLGDDLRKCVQVYNVQETNLRDLIQHKLVLPEEKDVLSPSVRPCPSCVYSAELLTL